MPSRGVFSLILASFFMVPASARAALSIAGASGIVQFRRELSGPWSNADRLPAELRPGDQVRTGLKASATLRFDDGSTAALEADASLAVEEDSPGRAALRLYLGRLRASVRPSPGRRFEVRTPTAVCMVRGTEFDVTVFAGGRTTVDLHRGLVGVEDNRGDQVLLHPNESISVDRGGMGVPQRLATPVEARHLGAREAMRRELALDAAKEEALAAAEREIKLAEYQQGKALVDLRGNRVRVEEYVLRPAPDSFKFVSLSKREGRIDYFYWGGTFDRALPTDLAAVLRELGGTVDSGPSWALKSFEAGRSNLTDSVREAGADGHSVEVNHNLDDNDNVTALFDASTGRFVDVTGRPVFQTLFDKYGLYINGRLKYGWTGSDIQGDYDKTEATDTDPLTLAHLTAANAYLDGFGLLAHRTVSRTFPDSDRLHQKVYESYSDGTFISWDDYLIDGEGRVGGFPGSGPASDAGFRQAMPGLHLEQVVTASEFGGRRIDLVMTPTMPLEAPLGAGLGR